VATFNGTITQPRPGAQSSTTCIAFTLLDFSLSGIDNATYVIKTGELG